MDYYVYLSFSKENISNLIEAWFPDKKNFSVAFETCAKIWAMNAFFHEFFLVFIDKAGVRELSDRWQFLSSNSPCILLLQEESYTCQLTSLVYQLVHHSLVRNRGANCQLLLWDMGTRGWPPLHMTPCWAVVGVAMLCTVLFAGSVLSASEQKLNCLIDTLITDHCFLQRCNCPKQFVHFIDNKIIPKINIFLYLLRYWTYYCLTKLWNKEENNIHTLYFAGKNRN